MCAFVCTIRVRISSFLSVPRRGALLSCESQYTKYQPRDTANTLKFNAPHAQFNVLLRIMYCKYALWIYTFYAAQKLAVTLLTFINYYPILLERCWKIPDAYVSIDIHSRGTVPRNFLIYYQFYIGHLVM